MRGFFSLPIYRQVVRVAWPLILSHASFTIMLFVDRIFLARYSSIAIQAALPAGITSFAFVCGFMSVAAYTNTFVAQFYGAKQYRQCSRATAQGMVFALFSAPIICLLIFPGRWLFLHSGHAEQVILAEIPYFSILMLGGCATPLNAALSSFFNGQGRTRLTMYITVLANALNLFLDYLLIFGKFGFPEMGIRGAAWATTLSGFIHVVVLLFFYFSKKEQSQFQTRQMLGYQHRLFWRMIRFALPSGIHLVLDIAAFSFFVFLTARMGELALSASNIALSINMLAFLPLIGLSIATSVLVGQRQGRQDSEGARQCAHAAVQLGILYMGVMALLFITQAEPLFSLFLKRESSTIPLGDILPLGKSLLLILACWGIADAINLVYSGALKGAGDTRFVMFFSLGVAWCVLVPGQWLIIEKLEAGITISWLWTSFYIALLAAGYSLRFFLGRWSSIKVIDPTACPETAT